MPYTDEQIRGAVMSLFNKYDKDNSGYVDSKQVPQLCNDLGRQLSSKKKFSDQQINSVLNTLDHNQDGRVSKDELFVLMRKLNP